MILKRIFVLIAVCAGAISVFYGSLVYSADPLSYEEKELVENAIALIDEKGFAFEAFLLRYVTVFRGNDNWLNASVEKENAFAATNFPFEIVTLYPDFFMYTADDVERAAILLHEAKHLQGNDETEAYGFVCKHRKQLGWNVETHGQSELFQNVRRQTLFYAPNIFICEFNPAGDCTH